MLAVPPTPTRSVPGGAPRPGRPAWPSFGRHLALKESTDPIPAAGQFPGLRRIGRRTLFQQAHGADGKAAMKAHAAALTKRDLGAPPADIEQQQGAFGESRVCRHSLKA